MGINQNPKNWYLRCCTLLFLSFLFFLVSCNVVFDNLQEIPRDKALEEIFHNNRADFESLVQMSNEDEKVIRITHDFTWVVGMGLSNDTGQLGFSQERWEKYKTLFRKLELESGITRGNDGGVWFAAFSRGLAVSGISKGYLYSEVKKDCPYDSLDMPEPIKEKSFVCKNLDKNWYLYISE